MDSSTKDKAVVCSKFFVQKESFFGYSKRLLTITKDSLIVDTLPLDSAYREIFEFSSLIGIENSSTNPQEFTIMAKKENSLTVQCSERSFFLCEFYKAWDKHQYEQSQKPEKLFKHYTISKLINPERPEFVMETKLIIYSGHLEMNYGCLKGSSDQIERCIKINKQVSST